MMIKETYSVAEKGNRKVSYANKGELEAIIIKQFPGEKVISDKVVNHQPDNVSVKGADQSFQRKKPGKVQAKKDRKDGAGVSMPMSQSNVPAGEEMEILINVKGEIVDERIRKDFPR